MSDETLTIETATGRDGSAVPALSFDMSTFQRLDLIGGENMQWPPTDVGGLWTLAVPAGKTIWWIDGPMSDDEAEDFELVTQRAIPIWGPIYFLNFFEAESQGHIIADGAGFSVWTARQRNSGDPE